MKYSTTAYRLMKDGRELEFNSEKEACDFLCPNRTEFGSCKLTACVKPSTYATNVSEDGYKYADNRTMSIYEAKSGTQPQREEDV